MASALPISVAALLTEQRVESFQIEYKTEWNEATRSDILQTICAFANDLPNHNGGYVILGVEDDGGRPVLPPKGLDPRQVEQVQKEIQGQIKGFIKPDYVALFYPEVYEGRHLLVIRCPVGEGRPYQAPRKKAEAGAELVHWIRTSSQKGIAQGEFLRQLVEVSARTPFDARVCHDLTVQQLSADRVLQYLLTAGSGLAEENYSLADRLRGLGLSRPVNGHESPLNAAALFFLELPQRRYRGARVEFAEINDHGDKMDEWSVEGPLPFLVAETLRVLRGRIPTQVRKRDDRAESDRVPAWPLRAVDEAIVNAVYHRGYDVDTPDPIVVELYPDRLCITSYPGPVPGVTLEDLRSGGVQRPPARNRHIGGLLKDIKLAEARGSGLGKIRRAMEQNGNPPPSFRFDDPERTYFEVVLPIHPWFKPNMRPLPLRIGRPAPPEEVVGREELVTQVCRALDGQHVCVCGPRGRGVSSVLGLLATTLREHHPVFSLNMNGVSWLGMLGSLGTWAHERWPGMTQDFQVSTDSDPVPGLRSAFEQLELLGHPWVLLLDQLEAMDDGGSKLSPFESLGGAVEGFTKVRVVVGSERGAPKDSWWRLSSLHINLPPLSRAAAQDLANRLLLGLGYAAPEALGACIAEKTYGLPLLLLRCVQRLHLAHGEQPKDVDHVLDSILMDPADPCGLNRRDDTFRRSLGLGAASVLMQLLAEAEMGLARTDLIARALTLSPVATRRDVLRELSEALELGWLVEVDGVIRFEHPVLRDSYLVWMAQDVNNRAF